MQASNERNSNEATGKMPPADTGNASNPSPHNENQETGNNQLLNDKAEKYLREVASIEDVPDAQDQEDMNEQFKKEDESG
jgi:hypothetical protein